MPGTLPSNRHITFKITYHRDTSGAVEYTIVGASVAGKAAAVCITCIAVMGTTLAFQA